MTEDNSTELLQKKVLQMYGKPRCGHEQSTLVQHIDPEYGWFACYQCDGCGTITRREVTADDLDIANDAPWLDVALYEEVTTERLPGQATINTLAFFGKATR